MKAYLSLVLLFCSTLVRGQVIIDTLYNPKSGYQIFTHIYFDNLSDTIIAVCSTGDQNASDSSFFNHIVFYSIQHEGEIKETHRIQKDYWHIGLIGFSPVECGDNCFAYLMRDTAQREFKKYLKNFYQLARTKDNWRTYSVSNFDIPFERYFLTGCLKTNDSYILAGTSDIYVNSPAFIAYYDKDLNMVRKKDFQNYISINSILPSPGKMYILSGYTLEKFNFITVGRLWQAKVDSSFNIAWQNNYDDTSTYFHSGFFNQGIRLNNQYYHYGSASVNPDNFPKTKGYLNSIDEDGNIVFEKFYSEHQNFEFQKMIESNGSLYAVAHFDSLVTQDTTGRLVHFSKISAETGQMQWYQVYKHWPLYNQIANLYKTKTGFLMCGSSINQNRLKEFDSTGVFDSDAWLLIVDTNGCIIPGCNPKIYGGIQHVLHDNSLIEVYPNPSIGFFTVAFKNTALFNCSNEIFIFDAAGKELYNQKMNSSQTSLKIENTFNYSGFAFLVVKNGNGTFYKKIILQ
ncbi:MAG: T9SS type A sorting domain-containing protein [Bacteroidia bacterium]|nr:T9SS type A sorting domain-containing protein [Bacteroidia bacterium]